MATDSLTTALDHFRSSLLRRDGAGLTDGELLGFYLSRKDEAAFEALVRRHGPMVLGVCRRIARNVHDADDAFQATFLVLARKAASIIPREAVGNWLYGVAHRTALKARTSAVRRNTREKQVKEMPQPKANSPESTQELELLLDEELSFLPDKYRLPIVLCDLEGRTRRDVARTLRIPDGTLSNRLATGRRILGTRLRRRGFAVALGGSATTLASTVAHASVPALLLQTTLKAAALVAAGKPASAVATVKALALMKGELDSMLLTKLKLIIGVLLVICVASFAQSSAPQAPPAPAVLPGAASPQPAATEKVFPRWVSAKAFVRRAGDSTLHVRAELPSGRFLKLLDADGKAVHVHEFVNWQPPPFRVDMKDVRVFSASGKPRNEKEWFRSLKEEALVFLDIRDAPVDAKQLAEAYSLYREELNVLVLPSSAVAGLDASKAFAPAKSLPQGFVGPNPRPGDPVPPPKMEAGF
jgi:RNA polymerase sigma factor (sigma-70 family)